uniref:Retropepsins domain-containing protein n=1 Tax=Ditylenchus dipsaci TaxID=166011 RepID=A0A915DB96_9BILA
MTLGIILKTLLHCRHLTRILNQNLRFRKQIQELKDQLESSKRPESVCNVSSQPVQNANQKSLPSSRLLLIPVTVEGHCYTALVDSGASQSIAMDRLAKKHNILLNQTNCTLHSVTGQMFNLQHRGAIQLGIGKLTRTIPVFFTRKLNAGHRPVFDLILGGDAMLQFPPYTVDNQNKLFTIATSTIAFGRPRRHKDDIVSENTQSKPVLQDNQCPSAVEHIASLWSANQIIDIKEDQVYSDDISSKLWNQFVKGAMSQ